MVSILFNYAVTYYSLPPNPCKKAGVMGKQTRSMGFWTLTQYISFIQHVTNTIAYHY